MLNFPYLVAATDSMLHTLYVIHFFCVWGLESKWVQHCIMCAIGR